MASPWFRISFEVDGRTLNLINEKPVATIGRSQDCDLVLPAETIGAGRSHATFRLTPEGWTLADNKSRNGTFINRERVETARLLTPGDVINLGPFEVEFEGAGGTPASGPQFDIDALSNRNPVASNAASGVNPLVSNTVNLAAMSLVMGAGVQSLDDAEVSSSVVDSAGMHERVIGMRGIQLFHVIGEALLSSIDLTDMLNRILQTVFDTVPARSGMIGMLEESGEVTPRVSRSCSREQIRISRSIVHKALTSESAILVEDTGASDYAHAASINALTIQSAMCVPLYHNGTAQGVIYVETHEESNAFTREHLEVVSALALFSAVAIQQASIREKFALEQKRREGLSRYFSPGVVDQIIERSDEPESSMLAEEREVTVLFADLRGFTAMSEKMDPQDVVYLINDIWELQITFMSRFHVRRCRCL